MSRMLSRTCTLGDYIVKDSSSVLKDYEIHREKHKSGYSVLIGTVRNSREWVKIYRSLFREERIQQQRFFALIKAFRQGIVLANNIFISVENDEYYLYTVESYYCNSEDKYIKLSKLLQKDDFDHFRKQKLFQNLVSTVKHLHDLGVAHLTLCPKNIWVENELHVRLRPFEMMNNIDDDDNGGSKNCCPSSKSWYRAPEQVFRVPMKNSGEDSYFMTEGSIETCDRQEIHHNNMASDLWSLGCIFAELFATVTPLFQSIDNKDSKSTFFKVLGFPSREEIYYMDSLIYSSCFRKYQKEEQDSPLIQELTKNLSKSETQILTSLLIFNPNKRPTAQILLELSFFKAYNSHKKQKSYADYVMQAFESVSKNEGSAMKSKNGRVLTQNTTQRPTVSVESVFKTPSRPTKSRETTDYSPLNTDDWWNLDLIEDCEVPKNIEKPIPVEKSKDELSNSSKLFLSYIEGSTHTHSRSSLIPQSRSMSPLVTNQRETVRSMYSQQQATNQNGPRVSLWSSECNENRRFSQISNHSSINRKLFESNHPKISMRSEFLQLKQIDQNSEKPKDFSMNQAGFTLGKVKTETILPSKPGSKAKLIIDVGTIKNIQQMEKGSFCCKITFRTRKDPGSRTKDTVELFSCFVPSRSGNANLSFKGETSLDSSSFCKLYNEELLEVQVFFKSLPQKDKAEDTTLYGVCRVSLLQALPDLPILFSKGGPIRGMRCWYDLASPNNEHQIVGQINLCASVEFEDHHYHPRNSAVTPQKREIYNEEDRSRKQLRKEVIMESLRFKSHYY